MKTLHLAVIGIVAVGAIAFWMFYEPILSNSDKEKFSKPMIEQVVNHAQLTKIFGSNDTSDFSVDLYDWSKNGKFIIAGFHAGEKNYLVSIDPNGTILQKLNTQNFHGFFPARISPSDRYVLFTGVTEDSASYYTDNLYLYDMVTNTMKSLTNNTNYEVGSHSVNLQTYDWLPDGNIIYNEEDSFPTPTPLGSMSFSLWETSTTGEKRSLLCYSIYYYNNPNFKSSPNSCDFAEMATNPDGTKIVFSDNPHIEIYNIDTNQTDVIPNFSWDFGANVRWIPNSSSIVYTHLTDEHYSNWVLGIMSTDGSFDEKDIYSVGGYGTPVVSPDGKYIMFANSDNDIMRVKFG